MHHSFLGNNIFSKTSLDAFRSTTYEKKNMFFVVSHGTKCEKTCFSMITSHQGGRKHVFQEMYVRSITSKTYFLASGSLRNASRKVFLASGSRRNASREVFIAFRSTPYEKKHVFLEALTRGDLRKHVFLGCPGKRRLTKTCFWQGVDVWDGRITCFLSRLQVVGARHGF